MSKLNNWEKRWHPLLQEWVILAATTNDRPWSGATLKNAEEENPEFDPNCYLCPGVTRASGDTNPDYTEPFAFTNDFASFSMDAPDVHQNNPFERSEPVHGTCRVLCFTPKHNITMAELTEEELSKVYELWKKEYHDLGQNPKIDNVQIFENKGRVIGASNPHTHGQIYATNFVPKYVTQQRKAFSEYKQVTGTSLLSDLVKHEIKNKKRIVAQNEHFVAFIPYFARFVYETYIVPIRHVARITDLTAEETKALVQIHKEVIVKFDNLYKMSFPNITMLQNAPTDGNPMNDDFHFHIEFYPPMRSPDKLKFLAGFESGAGNIINPVMPEESAQRMREASSIHYKLEK